LILGFAHLTINVNDLGQAELEWLEKGYLRTTLHKQVDNHPSKKIFANFYHPVHDILLMKGPGLWPIELTCHGPTDGENTNLLWSTETIKIRVREPAVLRRVLLNGLGFQLAKDGTLQFESRLPGWSCRIMLEEADSGPVRLDSTGPTCLAFYCNNLEEDAHCLIELGATDCTGIFDLTLGNRNMRIAMMRLPGGPLLELISIRTDIP
jgi:hypothetical protein